MDNDMYNEVVDINSDDDENLSASAASDKPIIQLFKRLIANDRDQNTVLTNAQIVGILHKEFNIDIWKLHNLELEIYLTIMKKYLKDWPQWDEFDRAVNNSKTKENPSMLDEILGRNYVSLKQYLQVMLDTAQPLARETIDKLKEHKIDKGKNEPENNNVILEICASRDQLNNLIYQRPNPEENNTIFNSVFSIPTQIKLDILSLDAILNWWGVSICISNRTSINLTPLYRRNIKHEFKHKLVNKNLIELPEPAKVLEQDISVESSNRSALRDIKDYVKVIDQMAILNIECVQLYEFIRNDLLTLPQTVSTNTLYSRYTNKYPYVRYLYKEVERPNLSSRKYDLRIEETLSPRFSIYIGSGSYMCPTIIVRCAPCDLAFSGVNLISDLKLHFEQHNNERDWTCTNCNKEFSMASLAKRYWCHRC